jgi:hypothetical protein
MISQKSFFVEPSGTVLPVVGLITFDSLESGLGDLYISSLVEKSLFFPVFSTNQNLL